MNLTQGDIKSQLIKIAFPAGIGMMFHTFYNITDTFYAGQQKACSRAPEPIIKTFI